jgi:hypothetical protein
MRLKFTFVDFLLIIAVASAFYFRNWQAIFFLVLVLACLVFRYYKQKTGGPPPDSDEFLIENKDETLFTAELDIGLDYRPRPNYFRTDYRFDTCQTKSLYEYRLEETDVLCRLIEDQYEDIGVPEQNDVRDGVVLESEIRKRDAEKRFDRTSVEDWIGNLKSDVQWHKMDSLSWHGLKYFILSKKLPQADARRYLRQELERFKIGEIGVFKEAEKYGLEPHDSSLDRFKLTEGKPEPSLQDWKKLFASAQS